MKSVLVTSALFAVATARTTGTFGDASQDWSWSHPYPGSGPGSGLPDTPSPSNTAFGPLEHLGANSPWFEGPNVFGISATIPDKCKVDQAVYITRHGSRYPDPGAYNGWIQNASFQATGSLAFLRDWKPVLDNPDLELAQVSPGGYDELYHYGVEMRTRYPGFYQYGAPFRVWANDYPRTIDSARLFARGYIGPNSTSLGTVYAINAKAASAVGNSLATSDSCPTFADNSGSGYADAYDNVYLPPIVTRLNALLKGNLNLTTSDVSNFPYLCGFESQILRRISPFCAVFTEQETLQYEYRQDLRYWYGTGPGAYKNASVQLPLLQGVVDLLSSGPKTSVAGSTNGNNKLGPLTVAFTHDNQINELASILGIFDQQKALSSMSRDSNRIYVSSRINPMRGTVAFERLNCSNNLYVRIRLNDAVYPVPACKSGPGSSCPLQQYRDQIVAGKWAQFGSFSSVCRVPSQNVTTAEDGGVNFFTNLASSAIRSVVP
ncbi:hypothetical protein LTR84_002021 [Exophiala bonariae]|uniref:3-phytase n=1 Tax=Exophiala bonariae TaxID=1690606 RepID=A0AAV9NCE9_9EURO|nr:hypothetical protein LTR84_002021 [Exophiala bonariae]